MAPDPDGSAVTAQVSMAVDPAAVHAVNGRLHRSLLATYGVLWTALAIAPLHRLDWLLENVLPVLMVGLLTLTYRRFQFSDRSYILIAAFLMLHAVGAHYTYEQVPAGDWLKQALGLQRNHFDRVAHFSFGLLLTVPVRELFARLAALTGFWSRYVALTTVVAFSGFFEILEAWVAQIVSPELGAVYLGSQGDIWDAQEDMTAALAGAVLATILTAAFRRSARRPLHPSS
jgi:putative membrane protein